MKKIIIFLCLIAGPLFAQDPDVGGSIIRGVGVPSGNPSDSPFAPGEEVSFNIDAGSSSGLLQWPPPGGAEFQVNISVQNMGYPTVTIVGGTNYFAAPEILDLGNGIYFISILQNAAIPEYEYTSFKITGTATGVDGTRVGYQANANPGGYNTTNVGLDNPSSFGVIEAALPVTLTTFEAVAEGKTAQLNWGTTQESNSSHFEIQRSENGTAWINIGQVASNGESKVLHSYHFTDMEPLAGENLYRLKMVDLDETYAYSRIRNLNFDVNTTALTIYPNPTTEFVTVQNPQQVVSFTLLSSTGQTVLSDRSKLDGQGRIPLEELTAGSYVLKIERNNGITSTHKLVVSK